MTFHSVGRIAVETEGDGEAVVLLHGLGGSSNIWLPLLPTLARHRSIRVDLPGSARSARAHVLESGPLSIEVMVESVRQVCETLGVERASFVGHSLGTIVCQHLALAHAKLVRGLVLLGALPAPPESARQGLMQRAAKVRAEGMQGVADTILKASLSTQSRETQPVTVSMVREVLMAQDAECYARSCEALAQAQAADIARIECPALLVTGDEDAIAPPHVSRAMAASLRHAQVEILPKCGHWTPLERVQECRRLISRFLEQRR